MAGLEHRHERDRHGRSRPCQSPPIEEDAQRHTDEKIPPGGGRPPLVFRGSKPGRLFLSGEASIARSLAVNNAHHLPCFPCSAIQHSTSSVRHAVTLSDNLTGCGNLLALQRRHKVRAEKPTSFKTCGCLRKPKFWIADVAWMVFICCFHFSYGFVMTWWSRATPCHAMPSALCNENHIEEMARRCSDLEYKTYFCQ